MREAGKNLPVCRVFFYGEGPDNALHCDWTPYSGVPSGRCQESLCYTPSVSPKSPKKLFLIDAMGFIFRAFYVPIATSFQHNGVPTKVPYLFSNMLRRVTKELQPDYVAVVFDPSGPTFRDKLFTEYKAQRQPMPNELFIQIPSVRRLCEAMRCARARQHPPVLCERASSLRRATSQKGSLNSVQHVVAQSRE